MRRLLDVTVTLSPRLPTWPGDPHARLERLSDMERGDACTVTRLDTVVHAGTHLDAPVHFVPGGAGVESLALDTLIGPCWVAHAPESLGIITAAALDAMAIPAGTTRLLVRTRNSALWNNPEHDFHRDFVAFSEDGARWLVDKGLRLVGIDYLSVEPFAHAEPEVHRALLSAGIVAVEGLDLRLAESGAWRLICLPLKLPGADGSPARVVLERED